MNDEAEGVPTLLDLAQDRSIQGRRHLAAVTRDLFAPARSVLSEREHALMSGILNKLVGDLEDRLRRLLEEELSRDPGAAPDALAALAGDEAGAARTILGPSGLLSDPALIEALRNRAREHLLSAALRASPDAVPPDQAGGGAGLIQGLLGHPDGAVGEATKAYLVEEARRLDSYQEPLVRPRDLDPDLAGRLAAGVAAALRTHLLAAPDFEPAALDPALEQASLTLRSLLASEARTSPATGLAECLDRREPITPELLIQVLSQAEVALFEALFGRLSALAPPRLQRVLYEPTGQDLAVACRALQFEEAAFGRFQALLSQGPPVRGGKAAQPAHGFEEIDATAAQAVLAHWRRDPAYLEAIERIQEARQEP